MDNIANLPGEIWKPVQLKDIKKSAKYHVSNYGRLKRWREDLNTWNLLSTDVQNKKSKKSKKNQNYTYYPFASETDWKIKKSKSMHVCVAESFCNKPDNEHKFVLHKDWIKTNNKATNLYWGTRKMLTEHYINSPRRKNQMIGIGDPIPNSKLNPTSVLRLKKKLKRGKMPFYKLAKEFGISHTQLKRIRRGENWGHITID